MNDSDLNNSLDMLEIEQTNLEKKRNFIGNFLKNICTLRAGSSKSELAKISELKIQKMCY